MKRVLFAGLLAIALGFAAGMPAAAHHSFAAAYDGDKPITVKGAITEVRLENPHSWFFLNGSEGKNTKVEKWGFEALTPTALLRSGYKPNAVKIGDQVTINGWHARDATQNLGAARELVMADGTAFAIGNGVGPSTR